MTNLTIRMDPQEKDRLMAWAAVRGTSATEYIKGLIAADMASGSPQERASAWLRENEAAISVEAEYIENRGVPGSHLALNHPWPDAEI
jgi:post-segregation antitoxin (ccd killing protein)